MTQRLHKGLRMVLLASALLLVAAGCAQGQNDADDNVVTPNDDGSAVTVEASEFGFDPSEISVDEGEFTIVLKGSNVAGHDFVIEEMDDSDRRAHVLHAEPGETARRTFNLEAGTYTFYCSIPGHREAGMQGTLTVG